MVFKILIIILSTLSYLSVLFFNLLRINQKKKTIPSEAYEVYNISNYERSKSYLNKRRILSIIRSTIVYLITLTLLLTNILSNYYYFLARNIGKSELIINLIASMSLAFVYIIINTIFQYIAVFKIEEAFGFNKMTKKLFFRDHLFTTINQLLIVMMAVIMLYDYAETSFGTLESLLSAIGMIIAVVVFLLIRRLLTKLKPIPEGSLKDKIEDFAKEHNFKFKRVYISDASRRTNKVNAYFQGVGIFRKIVLFDTLVNQYSEEEVLGVFAHEIAHAKNHDVLKQILIMVPLMFGGITLFQFLNNVSSFYMAFDFFGSSVFLTLFVFNSVLGFFQIILNLIMNPLRRKMEYRADRFEATHVGKEVAIGFLKKISFRHLADVNPHPLDVFINYSHPTPLQRIKAIENLNIEDEKVI